MNKQVVGTRQTIIVFILIAVAAIEAVILFGSPVGWPGAFYRNLRSTTIVKRCTNERDSSACYTREIATLARRVSFEEAFAITKAVQKSDPSFAYCHVVGHAISSAETSKNPVAWKDVAARCPSGVCSNGCIHGAFQERFRSESLENTPRSDVLAEIENACEPRQTWQPTGMERATCYHALGHLLMYITKADIVDSTKLCDRLAQKKEQGDFRRVCYDGAFMQIFQPLEQEDKALLAGKEVSQSMHKTFCSSFDSPLKRASCWAEGWPIYFDTIVSPGGIARYCQYLPELDQPQCMNAMVYILAVQLRFDEEEIADRCQALDEQWHGRCWGQVASRFIETDRGNLPRALAWCSRAPKQAAEECYQELVSAVRFNFPSDSKEVASICATIPNQWKRECNREVMGAFFQPTFDPQGVKNMLRLRISSRGIEETYGELANVVADETIETQHAVAHMFGELAYEKEGDKAVRVCDARFGFGCYHTVFGRAMAQKGKKIVRRLDEECLKKHGPGGLGCPHGIGHGLGEYLGPDKLGEQLDLCSKLSWPHPLLGCSDGVFMEYFFPVITDGNKLSPSVRPRGDADVYKPCDDVGGKYKKACYFALPSWWFDTSGGNVSEVISNCANVASGDDRSYCSLGIGYTLGPKLRYEAASTRAACDQISDMTGRIACRAGASFAFFANEAYRSQAGELCSGRPAEEASCLAERARMYPGL